MTMVWRTAVCVVAFSTLARAYEAGGGETSVAVQGGVVRTPADHDLYEHHLSDYHPMRTWNPAIGFRFGVMPLRFAGIEGEGYFASTTSDGYGVLLSSARLQAIAQVPGSISPFLVAGVGILAVSSDPRALGGDIQPAYHWGLGVRIPLSNMLDVRIDARHVLSGHGAAGLSSYFEFAAGLTFVKGRGEADRPPKVEPAPTPAPVAVAAATPAEPATPVLEAMQTPEKKADPVIEEKDTDLDGIPDATDKCVDKAGPGPEGCPFDRDEDGIPDAADDCPDTAGVAPKGCPVVADADKDGVPDANDKCPAVAAKTNDGCPTDRDGDGITDDRDACKDTPGVAPNGCPADRDGDGVPDASDKCPEKRGAAPEGCPEVVDSDRDGVSDDADKCPTKPETKNGFLDADGCPDVIPKPLAKLLGPVKGVKFAPAKSVLDKPSMKALDALAKALKPVKDASFELVGHTDNVGDHDGNVQLSLDRATAIRDYLVKKGVSDAAISARGAGPDEPVADNKKPAGRAKNQRIELRLK